MFGVKTESAAICRGCLSTDRKLSSLTKSYLNLLPNEQIKEAWRESEVLLCWECTAALKRMQLFQAQALKAHVVFELSLNKAVSLRPLSTLTTCHKHSYDAIFHEIEDKEKPIKKEKLSVESGDETYEEDCNDNEDSDHPDANAELSFEEDTMIEEFKVTRKQPLTVLKNKQQTEKKQSNVAVINTKIKVTSLEENEIMKGQMIMKRPSSSRIKKPVVNKLMGEDWRKRKIKKPAPNKLMRGDWRKKKKKLKRAASPVQFREGIRKSKRISGIVDTEEIESSNECNVENSYVYIELTRQNNANDCDNVLRDDVDLSVLNKGSVKNEKVKDENEDNKNNEVHPEDANDSGNDDRDNMHTDSKDGKGESLEAASGEVLEQSSESEEDESYEVNFDDFSGTIVEYHHYYDHDFDEHFTKVELNEKETIAALEEEPVYVTTERPYDCCYCGLCFPMNRIMVRHIKERHTQLKKDVHRVGPDAYYRNQMYRCNHCPVVIRKDLAVAHMKYTHRIRYHCKHCGTDCWSKADCKQHMITNHSRFDCDLCSETRPSWKLLERHKNRDHKVRRRKRHNETVQCEDCGKTIASKFALIGHQEAKHHREGSDPRLHCAPCDRTMLTQKHFQWHMKYSRAHSPGIQRSPCPVCGKLFEKYSLKLHYDRFHSDKTNFQCASCGKYFARKTGLQYHMDRVHLKIPVPKNSLCTICGRWFSNNRVLRFHIHTHTGERPFKCAFCPAAFTQPWPLKKHTETQHARRATRDTEHNTTRHTQSEAHSQSRHVLVESRSHGEEITEWQVQDEVIIE